MRITREMIAVGFVLSAFVGGAAFLYLAFNGPRNQPEHATALPRTVPLPAFALVDHRGQSFTPSSLAGHWSLLFFGFTHCPDICPATLYTLSRARDRMTADGENFPDIVLVSVDPERDTAEVLADYIANFGPGVSGVTGPLDELQKLTSALGVYFARTPSDDRNYSVDHSAFVILINDRAELHAVFRPPHKIDNFVTDLPRLADAL
jgi:protein SCO1/2